MEGVVPPTWLQCRVGWCEMVRTGPVGDWGFGVCGISFVVVEDAEVKVDGVKVGGLRVGGCGLMRLLGLEGEC